MRERRSISEKFIAKHGEAPKKTRTVKPWDLLNSDMPRATDEVATARFEICKECPSYIKLTHQCKDCLCIMNLKVKLAHASCPQNKWMPTEEIEE